MINLKRFIILLCLLIKSTLAFSEDTFEIEAEKFQYVNNKKTIIAIGKAVAKNQKGLKVFSDKIIYEKNNNLIKTFNNSKYEDNENTIYADNFLYDLKLKTIQANKNVVVVDKKKNKFNFEFFKYFESEKKGYGENSKIFFNDNSYLEASNVKTNQKNEITILENAKYTTCSKINNIDGKFCPSWSLKSNKVIHDKKNKKIIHKNAFLRIKNVPILYSPYISHPDPSVSRQSGFLPPLIKSLSGLGRTIRTPYFWAIGKDKDLTITPIYYFDEKNSILTSYRQAFKNSYLNLETGYSGGYKNLNKVGRTDGTRNYFFLNYEGKKNNLIFKNNDIKIKAERVSQENFLRVNKINTKLFKEDIRTLENSVKISSFEDTKRIELKAGIFENLDIADSGKYTYFLPDGFYSNNKRINKFNLNFTNYFQGKKFSKNQKQFKVRNLFTSSSDSIFNKNIGLETKFKANFFNKNIYNDNVDNEKNNANIDNYATLAIDSSLPFIKLNRYKYQTITPRVFAKYTTGSMQNVSENDKILNYSDIFSMNRTNDLDIPEVGTSIGHGLEYSFKKKNSFDNETLYNLTSGIGQVIRSHRLDNMPTKSSLNNSSSDYAGFFKFELFGKNNFKPSDNVGQINFLNFFEKDFINFNYKYNLDNNFQKFNRNNISLNSNYNKFNFSFNFEEKNNHIGSSRSGLINLKTLIKEDYYIKFETKKNLLTNRSEYLNFSINFENECIMTSLTLSKDFYNDKDITNSKTLILGIVIKPFSNDFAPDLTEFIN